MDHRSIDTVAIHAQEAAIHPMFESTGILAVLNKLYVEKRLWPSQIAAFFLDIT